MTATVRRISIASQPVWQSIRRGAVAGLAGTVVMTIPIAASRRLGLLSTPPPIEISANVAEHTPLPTAEHPLFPALSIASHLGYGSASGVLFVVLRRYLPGQWGVAGLVFGLALWVVSYVGLVPALRLYPWPVDDSRSRLSVMVVAHAVFGVTVAAVNRRLQGDGR